MTQRSTGVSVCGRGPARTAVLAAAALALTTLAAVPTSAAGAAPAKAKRVPLSLTLSGAGWGHGVGMSQYGALGMAEAGFSAEQIVRHYYTDTTVTPVRDTMALRVNLLHGIRVAAVRGEARATGGGQVQVRIAGATPVVTQIIPGDAVRLVRKNVTATRPAPSVRVVLRPAAGGRSVLGEGRAVTVRWAGTRHPGGAGDVPSRLDLATTVKGLDSSGSQYRYGFVKVWPSVAGGLDVVNFVQIHQEYLRGIAEVPSSWPAAALQAQVLAARSYALAKYASGVRKACRCHVDDGGGPYYDQTFVGDAKTRGASGKAWAAAVRATVASQTTGAAVLYQGQPITAFYSSSTGGRTQASKDVWGGDLPWAQSVDDHWSLEPGVDNPYASWTRTASQARLAALFDLPQVVSVDLSDLTAGDALAEVTATSASGAKKTISGAAFASGLGLPSRWVSKVVPTYGTGR